MASIDVIVPSYNYARYLPDCIASVLSQPVDDVRVVVIDNASTDGSLEVAREIARQDGRVEVVARQANLGPHASFNEGVDRARADYMLILCADDVLAPGSLASAIAQLEAHREAVFAFGPEISMNEVDGDPARGGAARWAVQTGDSFIERCCRTLGSGIGFGSVVVRTSVQKRAGHYDASLPYTDDLDMLMRLALHGAVLECDLPIGIRREHEVNMTKTFIRKRITDLEERRITFDRFFTGRSGEIPDARRKHTLVRRRLAETAYLSAASHFFRGHRLEAVELYKFGLGLKASSMLLPPLGYLVRKPGAFRRAGEVLTQAFSRGH
ncbi:MAG: glycosyltransferase family A protein [Oricola sp.]